MADQTFTVKSGFYNAINGDRKYTADDMNKPYARVVADGVFATNLGTPSTDLQVVASGTGMRVTVQAGQAIVGHKWFENEAPILVTVPANTALYSRIDSVIIQVDKRSSGRTGSVIYRTGEPAQSPSAPAVTQNANVTAYRVANILVSPAATSISQTAITDRRGTADCPWVTALIQQVDTSALWLQYQTAFAEQYAAFTAQYEEYKRQQQADWSAFIETLTEDLDVTMNMLELTHSHTTAGSESTISIGIAEYNPATDILEVYINGLKADPSEYTAGPSSITLATALESGNTVLFRVLKAVIGGDLSSVASLLERVEDFIDNTGSISNADIDLIIGGLE